MLYVFFSRTCIVIALSVFIPGFLFGFANSKGNRYLRYVMGVMVMLAFFIGTYKAWQTSVPFHLHIAGGCILLTASILFIAARLVHRTSPQKAFAHGTPRLLVFHGPYRFIRHPIYAAYILGLIGMLLLAPDLFLSFVALALIGLYVLAALLEEKSFANSELRDDYKAYSAQTGFLFPKLNLLFLVKNHQKNDEVSVDNPAHCK